MLSTTSYCKQGCPALEKFTTLLSLTRGGVKFDGASQKAQWFTTLQNHHSTGGREGRVLDNSQSRGRAWRRGGYGGKSLKRNNTARTNVYGRTGHTEGVGHSEEQA